MSDGDGVCPVKIMWNVLSNITFAAASVSNSNLSAVMYIDLGSELTGKLL